MLAFLNGKAQQLPLYSQYLFNDYAYNPAVAGTEPFYDVKSSHRYQWVGLTDAPRTYTLSMHGPTKNQRMGIGGLLYTDHVGPTRRTGFQLSYAYHMNVTDDILLSLALSGGVLEWKLDGHKITLADPSDQVIVDGIMRTIVPDAKFGFYMYHDKWFFGGAAPNLLRSRLSFANAQNTGLSRLENHFFLHGGYYYQPTDEWEIEPSLMLKFVSPVQIQADIMAKVTWRQQVWLGACFRTQDASSLMMGYLYRQNILLGYSYDFTMSNLNTVSNGTHELMIGIRFTRAHTNDPVEE